MWKDQVACVAAESYLTSVHKTILLVEDHLLFSKIMKRTIETHTPHRVIHLSDGTKILDKIIEHKPDLLILDYELPGKNGIELYDLVHATVGCEHIPAIIVSADLPQQLIAQRNLLGLPKPWKTDELLQILEMILVSFALHFSHFLCLVVLEILRRSCIYICQCIVSCGRGNVSISVMPFVPIASTVLVSPKQSQDSIDKALEE